MLLYWHPWCRKSFNPPALEVNPDAVVHSALHTASFLQELPSEAVCILLHQLLRCAFDSRQRHRLRDFRTRRLGESVAKNSDVWKTCACCDSWSSSGFKRTAPHPMRWHVTDSKWESSYVPLRLSDWKQSGPKNTL